MPARPKPLDFWASAPHLYSLTAWRMLLRARPWGWLSDAALNCTKQVDALPEDYQQAFTEEVAYKKARPWLCKP